MNERRRVAKELVGRLGHEIVFEKVANGIQYGVCHFCGLAAEYDPIGVYGPAARARCASMGAMKKRKALKNVGGSAVASTSGTGHLDSIKGG